MDHLAATATPSGIPALIPLDGIDPVLVEALLDRAFEPERRTRTAYRLREGIDWLPGLSFAALDPQDQLVGSIQCWPIALTTENGRRHPLVMVGPVAVLPEAQDLGYGRALINTMIAAIDPRAPLPLMMIGDPQYYGRWGFVADATGGWRVPGPVEAHRLLARAPDGAELPVAGTLGPWR